MIARKVMLLGEIGVGKSSLARRLVFDKFEFDYKPTIGVDIYRYEVPDPTLKPPMTLILWDTDGNFSDAIFKHVYMKEAAAALIVGDMSRAPTVQSMIRLADGFADAFPGRPCAFILNKSDLVADPETAPLPPRIHNGGISLTRTSAKNGTNVARAFIDAAHIIARRGL
ncbi:MAG: Rab family GTPase [Hyphomicrobium sp.]